MSITDLVGVDAGWHETMALPLREHAEKYISICRGLGYEAQSEPVETAEGWIVRWRRTSEF